MVSRGYQPAVLESTGKDDVFAFARDSRAEMSVIGSILMVDEVLDDVAPILKPEMFFQHDCRVIYGEMLEMRAAGKRIDVTLLVNRLKKSKQLDGVGGMGGIADLATVVDNAYFAKHYAEIVRTNSFKRKAFVVASKMVEQASDEAMDANDLLNSVDALVYTLRDEYRVGQDCVKKLSVSLMEVIQRLDSNEADAWTPSGFRDLDAILKMAPGSLTILAARPSMGKTALAMNIAARVSETQQVLFVSLEMSSLELSDRLLSGEARVSGYRMKSRTCSDEEKIQLNRKAAELSNRGTFTIDDTSTRTVWDIASVARRMKRKEGLGLIVLDYLQLLTPTNKKVQRQEQVAEMSRGLKQLARELQVPILCLAQLNRQADGNEPPKLSHLRESGAIEQDADNVMFVHRPEYYAKTESERAATEGKAEIYIAKQRSGPTGKVEMCWFKDYTRFDDRAESVVAMGHHEAYTFNIPPADL
ncbi:MAG: replicative DNA helicase [Pirellulales bacterium]